jgi:hypothetical protein
LTDSYNGVPTTGANSGNGEVSLDIEMAMAMAPGLAKIVVFEADPSTGNPNTILAAMVTNTAIKQFSCSWGWGGGPSTTTDNYFQEMIAQGQSFFSASGDSDAFTTGASSVNGVDNTSLANAPSSSPYITQVGGTTLTTGTGAAYASETVWNWGLYNGSYEGSSGGISSSYAIPSWQTNLGMTASHGSTSFRNIPDVALTADNVYVYEGNGSTATYGGTSCAAPLWAGFLALVNQQLAINTGSATNSAGFINPAVYAIGKGANANYSYSACFHDITSGNNYWSSSLTNFPAVTGFDLCTGWGTPTVGLITALAGAPDPLGISPAAGGAFSGVAGGPFSPASTNLRLTNTGTSSLAWSLITPSVWLNVSATNGTLASGQFTNLTARLTATASNLATGTYTVSLRFTNQTSHGVQDVPFSLQIFDALAVAPASGFTATGGVGGPFNMTSQIYALTNQGGASLNWGINNTSSWLSVSGTAGTLAAGGGASVTVSLSAVATNLPVGTNLATVTFSNLTSGASLACLFGLQVQQQQLVTNGGFETGDFTGWTLANNTPNTSATIYNTVASSTTTGIVHSGTYGAALGDTNLMSLFQTLATTPGQWYQLSLWLDNSTGGSGQQFVVNWNTNSPATNTLFTWSGTSSFSWTNLLFQVRATGSNTVLQFQARNLPYLFGLDDVSVTPTSAPLAITTAVLPDGTNNQAYSQTLAASGGQTPYFWTNSAGTLPQGITLATNGILSGTPVTNGTFNFTVRVTDALAATATQSLALKINARDTNPPILKITAPTSGQRWSNAVFTVSGTATDNVAVAGVFCALNGAAWTGVLTTNYWTNWTAPVTLLPGTNTVRAYAVDASGNLSATNQVSFDEVVTNLLSIRAVGLGTIKPNYSNAWLEIGRNYSITSTPASGFIFTHWTVATNWAGGAIAAGTNLIFMMQSNLTLQVSLAETSRPTLTLTAPVSGQRMTNALASVTGTASDKWGVNGVWYQLNSNAWNSAATTNLYTNWTQTVTLLAGTNTVKAYALNLGGNFSATSSVSCFSSNTFQLQLVFTNALPLKTNGLFFSLRVSAGLNGHIQVSTNLTGWSALTNFVGTNSTLNFRDPAATSPDHRFYRAVIP